MKKIYSLLSNKVQDSDANDSVAIDSYDTADDLKPAYDPLGLRREATVLDKDLSESKFFDAPAIKTAKVKQTQTFENTVQAATRKLSSWFDVDSLEEKFEDMTGYKVTITPSKKGTTLHKKT